MTDNKELLKRITKKHLERKKRVTIVHEKSKTNNTLCNRFNLFGTNSTDNLEEVTCLTCKEMRRGYATGRSREIKE